MVDFGLNVMSPFSLEGRQAECHNRLFLQNGLDRICAQLARSKSLATFASIWKGLSPICRLNWQRQADPKDHGGQGEQEGEERRHTGPQPH